MTRLKACIAGCGDIGYLFDRGSSSQGALTHFKAVGSSEKYQLCGVSDIRKEIRDEIAANTGVRAYEDFAEMLEHERPDVFAIAAPDELHIPMLKKALETKPALVFCEKPLGLESQEVAETAEAYDKAGILLQVNYTRRFLKEFADIRDEVLSGSLGKTETVTFYYSRGLVHNASHYLDLVLWIFGEPEQVETTGVKDGISEADKSYSFRLSYANGPEIYFLALSPTRLSFAEIDIVGSEGRIKFNYRNEIERFRVVENRFFSGYRMFELSGSEPVNFRSALPNAYSNIYEAVVNGSPLKSPGSASVSLLKSIDRIKSNYHV